MVVIVDRTNKEEYKIIGPFPDSEAATRWGADNLPGGVTGEWGWYDLEEPG